MKKTTVTFLSLMILPFYGFSQGISNLWMMGYANWAGPPFGGINMDFVSGQPSITLVNRNMDFDVTNGVICDKVGNLLFCSNGRTVSNALDNTMPNGNGLNPDPFMNNYPYGLPITQGNLIIPIPGDSSKFYLFHETCTYFGNIALPLELFYSMIDMTLDNGLGDLYAKNVILLQDTLNAGELTVTKHAKGRDWWLIFHKAFSNKFYKLLVTPDTISIFTQSIGTIRTYYLGESCFSPDGSKFVHYNVLSDVDIYDFDRCTGMLSNHINISINDSSILAGIAVSPNSRYVYVSSSKYVYQIDLWSSNIPASIQTVATWDGFYSPQPPYATTFFLPQLAPDNKIYIICGNSTLDIHVINNPDSLGTACDLQQLVCIYQRLTHSPSPTTPTTSSVPSPVAHATASPLLQK